MTHIHSQFTRWILSHIRAFRFALSELVRAPMTNFITVCVIGVAIALPLGFFVLLQNLQTVNRVWHASTPTISLYLKSDATPSQIDVLMQSLQHNKQIQKVSYISPNEGLKSFEKNTPFNNIAALFQKNPIPGLIIVSPATNNNNPDAINAVFLALKSLPLVDIAQLDMDWVTRLYDIVAIGKNMTQALSLLFGFGVIMIIGHTLRASLSHHIKEIQIMRLIGATHRFIRRPLLYRGMLYGLLGSIFAWLLIALFIRELQQPVSQLAETYHAPFQLQTVSFLLGSEITCAAIIAGFISAWLITTQFLNQPERME